MSLLPKRGEKTAERLPAMALREEVNRLFEDFFGGAMTPFAKGEWTPVLDVSETDTQIVVRAEVPGMDPKDIDISIMGDTLTIKGEKKEEVRRKEESISRMECRYGAFQRVLTLPASVDASRVNATYKNGILKITMDKKEESKSRTIQVKAE